MTTDFVPEDFEPPTSLVADDFVLEPLGPQHNESDHAAWSSSIVHIRETPGYADGSWPPVDGMSLEDNLADLTRHAADFEARRGFTFTVLEPGSREVIGCVYLYPSGRTSTTSRCSRGYAPTGPGSTSRWQMPWPPGSRATGPGSVRTAAGGERSVVPCHHGVMRSRPASPLVSLGASLVLVASLAACDGQDPGGDEGRTAESTAATSTPTVPPTPSEELGLAEGWGPTRAELDRAARIVGRMKLPDLAGQVIVADWQGTDAPVRMVRDLHLGGVIAFSANVASAEQVRAVNRTLTRQVPRKWPLFLGVDQEGGVVERLRGAATRFPTFMSTGAAGDAGLTQEAYADRGRGAARARLHRRLRPGRRRHVGPRRPDDRVAVRLVAARRRRRARRRGGHRLQHGRRPAGHQALPGPRVRAGRQPPDPAGAGQDRRRSSRRPTSCPSPAASRPGSRR